MPIRTANPRGRNAALRVYHPSTQCAFDLEYFIAKFEAVDPHLWTDPYMEVGEIYGGESGQGTEEGFALWILTRDYANISEVSDASDPRIASPLLSMSAQDRTISFLRWIRRERLQ